MKVSKRWFIARYGGDEDVGPADDDEEEEELVVVVVVVVEAEEEMMVVEEGYEDEEEGYEDAVADDCMFDSNGFFACRS